jgi:hypothetical protein
VECTVERLYGRAFECLRLANGCLHLNSREIWDALAERYIAIALQTIAIEMATGVVE